MIAGFGDLVAWPFWVAAAGLVAGFLAGCVLVWTESVWRAASLAVKAAAVTVCLASTLWVIAMTQVPRRTILALRGDLVAATVEQHDVVSVGRRYDEHCYRLKRANTVGVGGQICRDTNEFAVGETISVLVDPSGLIAPETPDEVAHARFWQILALASLAATLILCWISGGIAPPVRDHRRSLR